MAGTMMLVNPRKRRRKTTKRRRTTTTVRRNPVARKRTRRSPVRRSGMGGLFNSLVPAAIGGAGALGLDIAFGLLPLPANVKTGPLAPAAKIGGAILLGMVARRVTNKKTGDMVAAGAITVAVYSAVRGLFQKFVPNVPLGEYPSLEYIQAGQFEADPLISGYTPDYETRSTGGMSDWHGDGMGEYVGEYVGQYM